MESLLSFSHFLSLSLSLPLFVFRSFLRLTLFYSQNQTQLYTPGRITISRSHILTPRMSTIFVHDGCMPTPLAEVLLLGGTHAHSPEEKLNSLHPVLILSPLCTIAKKYSLVIMSQYNITVDPRTLQLFGRRQLQVKTSLYMYCLFTHVNQYNPPLEQKKKKNEKRRQNTIFANGFFLQGRVVTVTNTWS